MSGATRVRWAWAFGAALVAQVIAVYAPSAPGEGGIPHLDKLVHLTIFAAPVLCGLLAGWRAALVVAVFALHAGVSEFLQAVVLPHRDGSWQDALADLVGVGVGAALAVRWRPATAVSSAARGRTP